MLAGNKYISVYTEKGIGSIFFFRTIIHWKDVKIHKLTFSQRNGYSKFLRIGDWVIILKKRLWINTQEEVQPKEIRTLEKFLDNIEIDLDDEDE